MFCKECGKEINSEEKFCRYCGTKVEQHNTQEIVNNDSKQFTGIPMEKMKAYIDKYFTKEIGKKAIPVAVILLILLSGMTFINGGSKDKNPLFYIKKGDLFAYDHKKVSEKIAKDYQNSMGVSYFNNYTQVDVANEGKSIYFLEEFTYEEGGDLYVKHKGKEKEKIESGVFDFKVVQDEKYIVLLKDVEPYTQEGELCVYDIKKKEMKKISNKVFCEQLSVSPNEKYVAFAEGNVMEDEDSEIFLLKLGHEKEKVDVKEMAIITVNDKGDLLLAGDVHKELHELYVKQYGKDKEKVAKDAYDLEMNINRTKCVVLEDYDFEDAEGTLSYFEFGKEKKELEKDVQEIYRTGTYQDMTGSQYALKRAIYHNNEKPEQLNIMYVRDDTIFLKMEGKEKVEVADRDDIRNLRTNFGGLQSFAYQEDDTLYFRRYKNKMSDKIEVAEDDIESFKVSDDGSVVVFTQDDDLFIWSGKEPEKIDSRVEFYSIYMSEDGKNLFYLTDKQELMMKKGKKPAEEIADDVTQYQPYNFEMVYYLQDGDLYKKDGNKEAEEVDSRVEEILYGYRY